MQHRENCQELVVLQQAVCTEKPGRVFSAWNINYITVMPTEICFIAISSLLVSPVKLAELK